MSAQTLHCVVLIILGTAASLRRSCMGRKIGRQAHFALSSRKPLGASRATAIMAQFQKKGAVEKRAETVGTRIVSKVDSTSGRLYR